MYLRNKCQGKSSGKRQKWGNLGFSHDWLTNAILLLSHNNFPSESYRFNWTNDAVQILTWKVLTYTWMENVTMECNDGKCTQYLIGFYGAKSYKTYSKHIMWLKKHMEVSWKLFSWAQTTIYTFIWMCSHRFRKERPWKISLISYHNLNYSSVSLQRLNF